MEGTKQARMASLALPLTSYVILALSFSGSVSSVKRRMGDLIFMNCPTDCDRLLHT